MKRILLIGNTGQVGFELSRLLPSLGQVRSVDFPEINLADPDSIRSIIRHADPNVIVNAAAYTAVDKAESEPDLCRAINATAPGILAEEAAITGATLIHFSTDFVFDGAKRAPYTEEDIPNPLSVYGRTKLEGDKAIRSSGANHLIFRTAWVYGNRGRNFLLTIQRLAAEGKPLRIVADQFGNPTWCRVIAETTTTILGLLDKSDGGEHLSSLSAVALAKEEGERACPPRTLAWGRRAGVKVSSASSFRQHITDISGLYNLVCTGATSWHGFAREFIPASLPIQPITTADFPTPARRPAYSGLDGGKIQHTFGLSLPAWQTALQDCLAVNNAKCPITP